MGHKISAGEALGHRRMRGGAKEEVIVYLAASAVDASTRRRWYREWCRATLTKLRLDDLARVAPPRKPRETQLGLLAD
jgi:hypothetical protein